MRMHDNTPEKTGQRYLLDAAPCECDPNAINKFVRDLSPLVLSLQPGDLCTVARATGLALIAAALVNPINATESSSPRAKKAALQVAHIFESIARGIRRRVQQ